MSLGPDGLSFTFDLHLYRLNAIKKALYRYTSDYVVSLTQPDVDSVVVTLLPKDASKPKRLNASSLPNEVLDQELREVVAEETQQVRNILLAQAFAGLSITDAIGEQADYRSDPLHISGPPPANEM